MDREDENFSRDEEDEEEETNKEDVQREMKRIEESPFQIKKLPMKETRMVKSETFFEEIKLKVEDNINFLSAIVSSLLKKPYYKSGGPACNLKQEKADWIYFIK